MINVIICEFDPFHNGHRYLLRAAKEKTGAEASVCLMSGNFAQRGAPSVCEKHTRAAAAVRNGADLVLQIPTAHTLAAASVFAGAGVYAASALGVEASLCFGTEREDITPLFRMALIDKEKLQEQFRAAIREGVSYGEAVMRAYARCTDEDVTLLRQPNHLLAFEYVKAVIEQQSDLKIVNIKREGVTHDGGAAGAFASGSYLRAHVGEDLSRYLPEPVEYALDREKFEAALLFALYSRSADELSHCAEMGEGLYNRVYAAARNAKTYEELTTLIKSKRYPRARIRRALVSALLQNPAGLCKTPIPYLQVLAFNDVGRALLKKLDGACRLPVITKPSDARDLPDAQEHFALECRASDIYDFCSVYRHGGGREFTCSPVYVQNEVLL